jgi:hypothetical protein
VKKIWDYRHLADSRNDALNDLNMAVEKLKSVSEESQIEYWHDKVIAYSARFAKLQLPYANMRKFLFHTNTM